MNTESIVDWRWRDVEIELPVWRLALQVVKPLGPAGTAVKTLCLANTA